MAGACFVVVGYCCFTDCGSTDFTDSTIYLSANIMSVRRIIKTINTGIFYMVMIIVYPFFGVSYIFLFIGKNIGYIFDIEKSLWSKQARRFDLDSLRSKY